jgi:hypothetical protein
VVLGPSVKYLTLAALGGVSARDRLVMCTLVGSNAAPI